MDQSITLYLALSKGEKPDLETVARAALAFDQATKAVAHFVDPFSEIRLEFESGTEGSLKINSRIKFLAEKATSRRTLQTIALVVLGWFANDIRSYVTQQFIETVIREEMPDEGLTEDEIKNIAKEVAKALKEEIGEDEVRRVYQELERDRAIDGVGVTTNPDKQPRVIVPSSEFRVRGSTPVEFLKESETRKATSSETVTLISPVLLSTDRKWRFSLNGFEFGAAVKDHGYLDRLLSGQERVPMVAGITMDILLETREDLEDGVWRVKERTVLEVFSTHRAAEQASLDFSSSPQRKSDTDK